MYYKDSNLTNTFAYPVPSYFCNDPEKKEAVGDILQN